MINGTAPAPAGDNVPKIEDVMAELESFKKERQQWLAEKDALNKELAQTKQINFTLARQQGEKVRPEQAILDILDRKQEVN